LVYQRERMRKYSYLLSVIFIVGLLNGACSSEFGIDKGKFSHLYNSAQGIKALINAGASYQQVEARTQTFSGEIDALKDHATNRRERDLIKAYDDLLAIYKDGLLLWKYKLEFPQFDPRLKGRIYVAQDVEPIVLKYRFETDTHVYKPTGQSWKSIDENSIQKIWENANFQLQAIHNITHY
jgi:hypothetical protein